MEELLEAVFSVQSVPKLYNKDEAAITRESCDGSQMKRRLV
jgi:hypothetical protein